MLFAKARAFPKLNARAILPHKNKVKTALQSRFDPHRLLESLLIFLVRGVPHQIERPWRDVVWKFERYVQICGARLLRGKCWHLNRWGTVANDRRSNLDHLTGELVGFGDKVTI